MGNRGAHYASRHGPYRARSPFSSHTVVFRSRGIRCTLCNKRYVGLWRIGHRTPSGVCVLRYRNEVQIECVLLMAKKIAVAQSTFGDMPETGLDVLNQPRDSMEVALSQTLCRQIPLHPGGGKSTLPENRSYPLMAGGTTMRPAIKRSETRRRVCVGTRPATVVPRLLRPWQVGLP